MKGRKVMGRLAFEYAMKVFERLRNDWSLAFGMALDRYTLKDEKRWNTCIPEWKETSKCNCSPDD